MIIHILLFQVISAKWVATVEGYTKQFDLEEIYPRSVNLNKSQNYSAPLCIETSTCPKYPRIVVWKFLEALKYEKENSGENLYGISKSHSIFRLTESDLNELMALAGQSTNTVKIHYFNSDFSYSFPFDFPKSAYKLVLFLWLMFLGYWIYNTYFKNQQYSICFHKTMTAIIALKLIAAYAMLQMLGSLYYDLSYMMLFTFQCVSKSICCGAVVCLLLFLSEGYLLTKQELESLYNKSNLVLGFSAFLHEYLTQVGRVPSEASAVLYLVLTLSFAYFSLNTFKVLSKQQHKILVTEDQRFINAINSKKATFSKLWYSSLVLLSSSFLTFLLSYFIELETQAILQILQTTCFIALLYSLRSRNQGKFFHLTHLSKKELFKLRVIPFYSTKSSAQLKHTGVIKLPNSTAKILLINTLGFKSQT